MFTLHSCDADILKFAQDEMESGVSEAGDFVVLLSCGLSVELERTLDSIAETIPLRRPERSESAGADRMQPAVVVTSVLLMASRLESCHGRILVLDHPSSGQVSDALQSGYLSVLSSSTPVAVFEGVIREAAAQSRRRAVLLRQAVVIYEALDSMSIGELQVFQHMLEGTRNKQISSELGISQRTVEARRKRVFEKTGTASVAKLVRLVVETVGVEEISARSQAANSQSARVVRAPHFKTIESHKTA